MPVIDSNEIFFTQFEPKVKNRFILYMDGVPSYMINKVGGISLDQGEIQINHINTLFKVKGGRSKWGDLTLGLYDPITPSGTLAVMEWVRLHHESVTGRDGYSDFYKRDLTIAILGPVGDIVSEWVAKGAFIKSFKAPDYDWSSDSEASQIELNLSVDYMVMEY